MKEHIRDIQYLAVLLMLLGITLMGADIAGHVTVNPDFIKSKERWWLNAGFILSVIGCALGVIFTLINFITSEPD
jgi:hypothetical protein